MNVIVVEQVLMHCSMSSKAAVYMAVAALESLVMAMNVMIVIPYVCRYRRYHRFLGTPM